MSVITTNLRLSVQKLWMGLNNKDAGKALVLLAQNQSRLVVTGPAALTNNGGGATGGPVAPVSTPGKVTASGANLANRTTFLNALATVDNAMAVLATYLNTNVFTKLGADPLVLNSTGVVALAGTIAAITSTVGAGVDGSGSNSMTQAEAAALVSTGRNNLATLLKAYNAACMMLGVNTIPDTTGGKADAKYSLYALTPGGAAVPSASVASSVLLGALDASAALLTFANDLGYIANQITTNLLSAGVLSNRQNVLIVP